MSRAARSVYLFGFYLGGTGFLLMAGPNLLLRAMGMPAATEPWVHVLGVVVFVLGTYYIGAARAELTAFFRMTTWGRPAVLAGFIALILLGDAPWQLAGFGVVDVLGALWTSAALKADAKAGNATT